MLQPMRLPRPFFQLPLRLDSARLQAEVAALPQEAWIPHPDRLPGNSVVQLISPCGVETEQDIFRGVLRPTRWLGTMPYARQILAGLGVVWSRVRLMRIAPGAVVPDHADINHHWHTRVRVHIPLITSPVVRFHCGGDVVHMAAGDAWIFDNWRRHRVDNAADRERVHLVADTSGTAEFWRFACGPAPPRAQWRLLAWQTDRDAQPMTESDQLLPVMPAAEVEMLLRDLCCELTAPTDTAETRERAGRFTQLLESFVHDWRQLCALHGTGVPGVAVPGRLEFRRLAADVHSAAKPLAEGLVMRTNGVRALHVLEARVLKHLVIDDDAPHEDPRKKRWLEKPVFIVAAPRSGSTLLFETLACSTAFNTFGGEAHWLIEDVEALRPGAPGIESNRLTAAHASHVITAAVRQAAMAKLQGPLGLGPAERARLLEKTPKNSLRIPFLKHVFPDARFIFLWRDPRENLSSIMEAWRSGAWVTYPALPGWDGPWSLLLPPHWQSMRNAPLASIAARQWLAANDTALEDLQHLPRERWTSLSYHSLLADPRAAIRRLCEFADVPFDQTLEARTAHALPLSRFTHTPPATDKWRRNQADIEAELAGLEHCWQRLLALGSS